MSDQNKPIWARGLIAWMVLNRVTPNLILVVLLLGGFLMAKTIRQEVYPEFELDMIEINVTYPQASPEEVEQGVVLPIEEAIRSLDDVSEIRSEAGEGFGSVTVELMEGADSDKAYQVIQQKVDRITTFPEDIERPEFHMLTTRSRVLEILIYGDTTELVLRELAEQVQEHLLLETSITQVELVEAPQHEVHVQIDRQSLRRYDLALQQVADVVRGETPDLPAGRLETRGGDILLRAHKRRGWAREFAEVPIISTPDGAVIRLGEIGQVVDGFEETKRSASFNGLRAIAIEVYRVGDQTPVGVADAVRHAMYKIETQLPQKIRWTIQHDNSRVYRQRLELLLKNAFWGLVLVLVVLGLFLESRLAFWVTLGIPTSFFGAFLFLPGMGVTVNMVSMFAFIIALGIVIDDSIVVGENIYELRHKGVGPVRAAVLGARGVVVPVSFSILTNIIAFLPLLTIPGWMGKLWRAVPLVVATVFAISLIESLLILPCHLSHVRSHSKNPLLTRLHSVQQAFGRGLAWFVRNCFEPILYRCIQFRYITVTTAVAILIVILGVIFSGRIGIILMPRVESDTVVATAMLPRSATMAQSTKISKLLTQTAWDIAATNGDKDLCEGVFSDIYENRVEVSMYLTEADLCPLGAGEVANLWRQQVGTIPGVESLRFESDVGSPGEGPDLTVELSHHDPLVLEQASEELAEILARFVSIKDVDDGRLPGKPQLNITVRPEGQSLGLTATQITHQIRDAFYGAEAHRQQRGRNEVRIIVKLPEEQRISEYDVEQFLIRTPSGTDVPLLDVAELKRGRAYDVIEREDGKRSVEIEATVNPIEDTDQIMDTLEKEIFPRMAIQFPGLACDWDGRQEELSVGMERLISGFVVALLLIFAMLAIPFGSYVQPIIVMVAVPFGIVGVVLGHLIMCYALSLMSMMGVVALSGVVVNDSFLLIINANERRKQGASAFEAIYQAGVRRFRPIVLTTLTTFCGLTPMMLETSVQGRFMIPMAISLAFGILFATGVSLVLVPCLYLLIEDVRRLCGRII